MTFVILNTKSIEIKVLLVAIIGAIFIGMIGLGFLNRNTIFSIELLSKKNINYNLFYL